MVAVAGWRVTGAPSAGLGIDGDWYIATDTHYIYGPKASGTWPAGTSLVGPQGQTGQTGQTGNTGAAGAAVDLHRAAVGRLITVEEIVTLQ